MFLIDIILSKELTSPIATFSNNEEFPDQPKGSRHQSRLSCFALAEIPAQLTIDQHCDCGHRDDNEPQFVSHDRALAHQPAGEFRSWGSTMSHQFDNGQTLAVLGSPAIENPLCWSTIP